VKADGEPEERSQKVDLTALEVWKNRWATKIPLRSALASGYGAIYRNGRENK